MCEFRWPWMGLLLLVPLLVRWLWPIAIKAKDASEPKIGHAVTGLDPKGSQWLLSLQALAPRRNLANWLYPLLLWLTWIAVVLALMWPQWLTPHTEVQSLGYDLMLAIDDSHSMEALDFTVSGTQVTRMQVVKGVMERFINKRVGDRIGLIIFGNQAFVLSPLTVDREAVRQLLASLEPGIAGSGTALGDAIALGVKKLRERPKASRIMILMADGDSTHGLVPPLEAAGLAAMFGVRIYVIGVGSKEAQIPIRERDPQDGVVKIRYRTDLTIDETMLKRIAGISHGAYFRATDTSALDKIYSKIDELERTKAETRTALLPTPLYRWPLGIAILTLLWLGLFPKAHTRFVAR
ncbi:von Willebrand factor A [Achromatium sp. WMS2]|nr:von Willebrand factor A [Achromatium sp. WMS2]